MTKLLIIDDEPLTVDMLQTFLQINGFDAVGAYGGEDGLVLMRLEKPEALILDLMLPDIEGFEVLRRVRSSHDFAALPVIVLSARGDDSARIQAMECGANMYMMKPPPFAQLVDALNRLIEEQRAALSPTILPVDLALPSTDSQPPTIEPAPQPDPDAPLIARDSNSTS